jgi:PAS domain S-box-containing protein
MVFTTRPDGYCDYQSQQWVDFTGVPMNDHLGDGWNKLLFPEDRPQAYAAWRAAVEERAQYDLEYRVRRRDGQYEWFKVRGVPIRDAGGQIARWFGVATNIEAIKRTEEALREVEQRFRLALRNAPVSVAVQDRDLRYVWAYNQRTTRPEEVIGKLDSDILTAEEAVRITKIKQRVLDEGIELREQMWLNTPSGRIFLDVCWEPVLNEHGKVTGVASATVDLTPIKVAEEALRESESRLRLGQQAAKIGVFEWDIQTGVNVWSPELEKMYGLEPGAFEGTQQAWEERVHSEDRDGAVAAVRRAFEADGPAEGEWRVIWPDDSVHWVLGRFQVSRDHDGKPLRLAGVNIDISARKQAEMELKVALHEKEVLLKEIHHRVKNNMQVISSLVDLQAGQLQDEAVRNALQDLTHRVRSMALVHEKLYQSTDMARIDFAEYVQSLLNYLWRSYGAAASRIRLVFNLNPVTLPIHTAVPCGLILNELATNALKHAFCGRDGGEVHVSLQAGEQVCLRIRDNGIGLPAGLDWRQAKSLGLRLVQILARQLSAAVEVSSGEGTEFSVSFGGTNL